MDKTSFRKTEALIATVVLVFFTIVIGRGFLLFANKMFGFHDMTQAARVSDFVVALKLLHIPPRIAPNFSFGMGYPIFNHYAQASYWITSALVLATGSIVLALKLAFLLPVVLGGVFMYLLLRNRMSAQASIVGAVLYASSPYFALEVFVRGNLGEVNLQQL